MDMLNKDLKTFPKNGSIELATQKLVSAIADGKLNEKEIDFLNEEFYKEFREFSDFKGSLTTFSREEMEQGIKAGLEKNNDFLLDMQYSGQLVPVPNEIYTNDRDTLVTKEADIIYKELLNGESVYSYSLFDSYEAKDFYCGGLLKDLYDSDKFAKLREADADVYKITEEFLSVIKNEEPAMRDKFLQEFHDRLEDAYDTYLDCGDEKDFLEEDYQEKATEILKSKGFLNDPEAYLMLGENTNWRGDNGISLEKVEDLEDIIKSITPNGDYTINITAKENTPYFEAVINGSHCYLLPESQWDKLIGFDKDTETFNKGYDFINNAVKEDYIIREIFHSRKKEIEMDLEAKKDPIVAEIKKVYDQYISDNYGSDTQEKFEDNGVVKAWEKVCQHLAEKLKDETRYFNGYADNPLTLLTQLRYEGLLTEFNPTLQSSETISNAFDENCKLEIHTQYRIDIENKYDLERGYTYLKFRNRDLSVSEIEKRFMKDIVKTHGTDFEIIKNAVEIVTEQDRLTPPESAKLLNDTLASKEYKQAFEAGQGKTAKNVKQF